MDRLVSLIHPNSINELMPNPFQIDSDIHRDIPKTKAPNIPKTSIKLTISKRHNFALKTAAKFFWLIVGLQGGECRGEEGEVEPHHGC